MGRGPLIGTQTRLAAPSPGQILRVWLALGLQSFGGGAATLTLIYRAVVDQHQWLTDDEFTRAWALCQIAPGINLLAMTILIGKRLAGATGVLLCLLGLLLPSVTITLLMTACYARFQRSEPVQAALRGVLPATVGLGLLTAFQMVRPLLQTSRREGRASFLQSGVLLMGSGFAVVRWHAPVVLVLCAAGLIHGLTHWWRHAGRPHGEANQP